MKQMQRFRQLLLRPDWERLYNEAVRKDVIPGVDRAVIEKNGVEELKFLSRAAVYTKLMKKAKGED